MAAMVAAPTKSKPVTTRHLAAALAEQHQLSKKQGLEMLEELVAMITKHLKKGERVKIAGLGILVVRKRAARMGQPCDRRADPDQGVEKGCLPCIERSQDGDLTPRYAAALKPRRVSGGVFLCPCLLGTFGRTLARPPGGL